MTELKDTIKYVSTKTYKSLGPVAYRQWRADSHCNQIHGYALSFHFEFEATTLDARNWVVDFGSLKQLKGHLEDWFDHALLVAEDDPMKEHLLNLGKLGLAKITLVEKTGCEGISDFLYHYVNEQYLPTYGYGDRVWCTKVEVRETESNMAMVVGSRPEEKKVFHASDFQHHSKNDVLNDQSLSAAEKDELIRLKFSSIT